MFEQKKNREKTEENLFIRLRALKMYRKERYATQTPWCYLIVFDWMLNEWNNYMISKISKKFNNKKFVFTLTIGLYPAPVVAAIGCGVQPAEPGLAAFFGEFQLTPLRIYRNTKKKNTFKENGNQNFNKFSIYLTWADADLFIVKFSANDANELSKSPVSTLPVLAGCCTICCWPPPAARIFPCCIGPPVDEAGFNTSPNASKPVC